MFGRLIASILVYRFFRATEKPGQRPEKSGFLWLLILVLLVGTIALYIF